MLRSLHPIVSPTRLHPTHCMLSSLSSFNTRGFVLPFPVWLLTCLSFLLFLFPLFLFALTYLDFCLAFLFQYLISVYVILAFILNFVCFCVRAILKLYDDQRRGNRVVCLFVFVSYVIPPVDLPLLRICLHAGKQSL